MLRSLHLAVAVNLATLFAIRICVSLTADSHHHHHHHHHHHLSLNREGRWGTTDDFTTNFLHFPLLTTALWDLANSRPVHSLVLSPTCSSVCLVFFPPALM